VICFPEYLPTFSQGTRTNFGKSSDFLVLITQSERSASSDEPTPNSFVNNLRRLPYSGELFAFCLSRFVFNESVFSFLDMLKAMNRIVLMTNVLETEERNLLSTAYKNVIAFRRST